MVLGKSVFLLVARGARPCSGVGWMHHQLNGYKFKPTPGDSEGQGSLEWMIDGEPLCIYVSDSL